MWCPQAGRQGVEVIFEVSDARPRKAYIALLLSVCPGLGQLYAGRFYRGIATYTGLIVVSWLSAIAYMYVKSRYAGLAMLSVPFAVAGAICADAVRCAVKQRQDYQLKWYNKFWVYGLIFVFLFVTVNPLMDFLVGKHIVRAFFVTSESMTPSVLRHDLVLINKIATPEQGDIVLLEFSDDAQDASISNVIEDQTLRRIVGVAGNLVEIRGRQVYIDGAPMDEPYVYYGETASRNAFTSGDYRWGPETVPEDSYFVLSDARQYGFDSRVFGFTHKSNISGVAAKVFWSWNLDQGHLKWERTTLSF
ncbi:MAG: signal peptidase I [Candidatus Thiodiazotropha sp. (ex Epidulcina cf. delphinae)]|nr:signal peptidase I [Candidatus Thiodiazotropha sp. (ex Epidulcina cf. delphinae)]